MRPEKRFFFRVLFFPLLFILLAKLSFGQHFDPKSTTQKFASALQIINFAYVDTVDEGKLVEKAIIATLKELDPHSQYISKEDLQRTNEPLEGNFDGIGISFQIHKDTILVISPVPGGPAEKLGILAGDKIVKIDGKNATGTNVDNNYVFKQLRGDKGTLVNVSIFRKGKDKLIEYAIRRDRIPINSIDASFMATSRIGYIKLNRFSRTTMDEFRMAIGELKDYGMENLILDLRGNSGGYLDVAIDLADEFLGSGKLVLYTEGSSSPRRKYKSSFRGEFEEGKLVILIDEGSASASEIVAGSIQDWDRGLIVGRRSFGKGLVQRPYYLPDSSVIRLTVARYYTPTGRCIQKPYEEGYEQYYNDLLKRLESGELTNAGKIDFPDSLKYYTPKNRIVYGGGGIMPDVFVPWDSTKYTDFYVDLLSKGVFNDFVLEYVDNERSTLLHKFNEFQQFNYRFKMDDELLDDFVEYAENADVFPKENEIELSSELIRFQLKALIARNLYKLSSYFEVLSTIDEGFQKAVDVLREDSFYAELIKD
ncbi:MAG: S41 family peptidase [Bacteroidales bacterium]|nr:S41 family peptidase [Bacteroidales bacterium]